MQSISLVILAAGLGSRYGGQKQTDGLGPNQESLLDYAIYDGLMAGFTQIVFVVRESMMPGSLLFDLGDGLRSIATSTKEDELDLMKVRMNWVYYQQYQESFLSEVSSLITEVDRRYIHLACSYMTFIMGLRFYTDFLNGNLYYSCNYPEHNLVRARNQFHLFHQMMEETNG